MIQIDPELSRRLAGALDEIQQTPEQADAMVEAAEMAGTFNSLPEDIQRQILEAEADYGLPAPYNDPEIYPDGPPSKGTVTIDE